MKNNNKWFSLIIAIWIVIVITLLAFTVLEYIIPFSRDIKWVENSSVAFYQANNWLEVWLYNVSKRNYWWGDTRDEFYKNMDPWNQSYTYSTESSWSVLPPDWEWNSEYDLDRNTIYSWNPIQLVIWNWYFDTFSDVFKLDFKVPNLDNKWWTTEVLSWASLPIVNWQLSSSSSSLNSSWSIITADVVNGSEFEMNTKEWSELSWIEISFVDFYDANCNGTLSWCVLKFSIINKLETDDGVAIPYLEWKINVEDSIIPLRYTKIVSSW